MPTAPRAFRPANLPAADMARRAYDTERQRAHPWRKWYSLALWSKLRAAQLARQPLCERHLQRAEVVAATVVNHRTPHRGVWPAFVDPTNHESVCKPCHDSVVQAEEARAAKGRQGYGRVKTLNARSTDTGP